MSTFLYSEKYFKTRFEQDKRRDYIWKKIAYYIDKLDPNRNSVLELGAGYSDWINNTKASIKVSTDISKNMSSHVTNDVTFITCSAMDLTKLEDRIFDRIQLSNLLEHLTYEDVENVIVQIKLKLKANGSVVVIQPNFKYAYKSYFDDFTHRSIFTHVSLSDIFIAHGFRVKLIKKKFLPLTIKSRLRYGYRLINLYLHSPFKIFAGQMLLIFEKIDD